MQESRGEGFKIHNDIEGLSPILFTACKDSLP